MDKKKEKIEKPTRKCPKCRKRLIWKHYENCGIAICPKCGWTPKLKDEN